MIQEFSVKAKPANRRAHTMMTAFLIVAAILFVTSLIMDRYVGVMRLFVLGFITAAIFLYTKYVSAVYYYEGFVTDSGEPLFVVRRLVGKRSSTLCRVAYREILSIKMETREEFRAHKTPRGTVKYLYTPTLYPEKVYRIQTRSAYERAEVVIECSDALAALIRSDSSKVRALAADADEE